MIAYNDNGKNHLGVEKVQKESYQYINLLGESARLFTMPGHEAMGTNRNTGGSLWAAGNIFYCDND